MGRTPCSLIKGLNRGSWGPEEDLRLTNYIETHGEGGWTTLPKKAGLLRTGKSCRLRWRNYLRPDVKRGHILPDEEDLIFRLHRLLGNRWSLIAGRMPGRTDNEIKNYWNTHVSKKLLSQGINPRTHKPLSESQDVMCSNPRKRETSKKSQLGNNNNMAENIVDSRANLQEVVSKVAITTHCNEDDQAAATGCVIPDPVILYSDPCLNTPSAALGDFNSDIFPLLLESFVDEELHLQESAEQNVELWPLTQLEAANLSDDLWSIPSLSLQYHRIG